MQPDSALDTSTSCSRSSRIRACVHTCAPTAVCRLTGPSVHQRAPFTNRLEHRRHMNLSEAVKLGLIAAARQEQATSGLTIQQCIEAGKASVRVHERALPADNEDEQPPVARRGAATAEMVCRVIREAGHGMTWRELDRRCNKLTSHLIHRLLRLGVIERTGEARHQHLLPTGDQVRQSAERAVARIEESKRT